MIRGNRRDNVSTVMNLSPADFHQTHSDNPCNQSTNMKHKLASLFAVLPLMTAANAATILLGGYDGTNAIGSPKQDAAAVGNFSFGASFSGTVINNRFNPGAFYNGGALWGNTSFTTAADSSNNSNFLLVDVHPVTLTFVATNTGTQDILLDAFHWRAQRDRGTSPTVATITYTAGDLTDTVGGSADQTMGTAASSSNAGYDFALSSILTDRTLAAGESATFTWVTNDMDDRLRLDNFAISGSVIPEPSSAALLGLAGLALVARRRR